ncbi:MAG: AbrB/MazE/SpoVT family DNA-binding domain-containing protein [Limisphaerales bacterium]
MTTTITESNLVSIPADIARDYGIHPGTRLEWAKGGNGSITVRPLLRRGELARQLLGAGRHLLKPGADPSVTWSVSANRMTVSTRPTTGDDPPAGHVGVAGALPRGNGREMGAAPAGPAQESHWHTPRRR